MTLKEAREQTGITQGELSRKTGINIPTLSNYESGNTAPILEDMVVIEKAFGRRLNWSEELSVPQKHLIVQNLICLSEIYPLNSVLAFTVRALREGTRIGDPVRLISHYASVSGANDEEPLKYQL